MGFLKGLKWTSRSRQGKRPEGQKSEERPKTEHQIFKEGLNSLRQLTDLEIFKLEARDRVMVQQLRVLYRDILVKRDKKPGNLDDLPGYSALATGRESILVVCTARGLGSPLHTPWLGTLAIETIERLQKARKTVFPYFCIERGGSLVPIMADIGLQMLRKAKVTQEKYDEYAQTFQNMDLYAETKYYVNHEITPVMLEIINNYFNEQDVLHIVIDAMDVIFGGRCLSLSALEKIVLGASPRVEFLVVAHSFPMEGKDIDRLGGGSAVLVYTPSKGETILNDVPKSYFS